MSHFMNQILKERLERDRYEDEEARRKREAEPRHHQTMLLSHLDDNPAQKTMFEEEL
ncbi:MAG: hypothetical protein WCJ35_03355 [Planctomycetota bacterium]